MSVRPLRPAAALVQSDGLLLVVAVAAQGEERHQPDHQVGSQDDEDPAPVMEGVQVVRVEQGLDSLHSAGETQREEEDQRGEGAHHLQPHLVFYRLIRNNIPKYLFQFLWTPFLYYSLSESNRL